MAGRPAKLDHVRKSFIAAVTSSRNLVSAIVAIPKKVNPTVKTPGIHPKYERMVVELAFLGMIASWEEFLERTLVRYLAGTATNSGYSPTPKYGTAKNIAQAYEIISRDSKYDPAKNYLKGNDTKWYRTQSDFFFSTHPFGCLENQNVLLTHANAIRNRVAHDSEKCKTDFKDTAIAFLHPAGNKLTQSFAPGNLLMTPVTRHFSAATIAKGSTHFIAYADLLEMLAKKIVP